MANSQAHSQQDSCSARRLGPRPLPQHLTLALALWGNSAAAWPSLRAALQSSNGERGASTEPLASALRELAPALQSADEAALLDALTAEGHRRRAWISRTG